jgi:hypothetical protein
MRIAVEVREKHLLILNRFFSPLILFFDALSSELTSYPLVDKAIDAPCNILNCGTINLSVLL